MKTQYNSHNNSHINLQELVIFLHSTEHSNVSFIVYFTITPQGNMRVYNTHVPKSCIWYSSLNEMILAFDNCLPTNKM